MERLSSSGTVTTQPARRHTDEDENVIPYLARLLASAFLRLAASRKALQDGQNRLDVADGNEAPLPGRRPARG